MDGLLGRLTDKVKQQYQQGLLSQVINDPASIGRELGQLFDPQYMSQVKPMTQEQALDVALSAPMMLGTTKLTNLPNKYFNENMVEGYGKIISSPYGEIGILSNNPFSPRTHSVTKFFVDESKRNKGFGKELIDEALKQYPTDIGAQVSSPASAKAFYNKGFRLAENPKASIDDIFKYIEDYSSAYMVK